MNGLVMRGFLFGLCVIGGLGLAACTREADKNLWRRDDEFGLGDLESMCEFERSIARICADKDAARSDDALD